MKTIFFRITFVAITLLILSCNKRENKDPVLFENFTRENFKENLCNDIAVDSKNNKWITTYAGLLKYDNQKWSVYNRSSNAPSDTLFNITIDSKDNIYCLTMAQSIVKFDGTNWSTLRNPNINYPTTFCVDHNDNLWVAALHGLYRFDGTNWSSYRTSQVFTASNHWANEMIADNNNAIWIASEGNGLVKFDGTNWASFTVNQDVPNTTLTSVGIDSEGIVWVGAYGFGAFKKTENGFTVLKRDAQPSLCNLTNSIGFDAKKNCWLGTEKGLLKYDGTYWTSFLEDEYEIGIAINALTIDKNNIIWVATDNSVYRIFN
jgi:ligand-binding sensor domain-containing protein